MMNSEDIVRSAVMSDCRRYRYSLHRWWNYFKPSVMFIGLNPSNADDKKDDPTIRRVMRLADGWGFGAVHMVNLFPYVTPYPEKLIHCDKEQININDHQIKTVSKKSNLIVFAWGSFDQAKERAEEIAKSYPGFALVINQDGSPRHPLYVPSDCVPVWYPKNLNP